MITRRYLLSLRDVGYSIDWKDTEKTRAGSLRRYTIMSRWANRNRGEHVVMTASRDKTRPKISYYCVDVEDHHVVKTARMSSHTVGRYGPSGRAEESHATLARGLSERWRHPDAVSELLAELVSSGRSREAAAIRHVLGHDDDEAAMRAYVSRLWADDWNSPEDSVYDE
jgi:hypothetical protein